MNPLPPPRKRTVRPPPPPVSGRKEFVSNLNSKPIPNSALESRLPSFANANVEPDDAFFIAAKNYVIKKLELEELKEELESAKYEETLKTSEYSKIFPKLENIYKKHKTQTIDDFLTQVSIEEIGTRIKQKETELNELKKGYDTKPAPLNEIQTKIISFNETLDSYLENKQILMAIKPVIETEINKGITIRNKLISKIEEYGDRNIHKTKEQQQNDVTTNWVPHYEEYVKLHEKISNLFNIEKFLVRNRELYENLNLSKYIDKELFHRVIYTNLHLSKLFKSLKKNVSEILKDYSSDNDFFMKKVDKVTLTTGKTSPNPVSKYHTNRSIPIYVNDKRTLEKRNKELLDMIAELTMKLDSNVELRVKEITDQLEEKQDELNQLKQIQDSSDEEKETKIAGLEKKIAESKTKYDEEMARLKEEKNKKNDELMEKMTEEQQNMKKEIERLQDLLKATPEDLTDKIKTKQEEVEKQEETNEFLNLVIESAKTYETDGFKASFDDLLNYQPEDNFMFNYAFSQIEQGKYNYLDEFLRNPVKIPDQIYEDALISQIKGTLAFKPTSQTH
jgi:chromosome segregation ATPase